MIIDRIRLSGLEAYLKDGDALNLAQSTHHRGTHRKITEGTAYEVSGVHLLLGVEDALKHMPRSTNDGGKPILSLSIRKEMFPNFYADPYASRTHTIAGFDDLQRGKLIHMRPMEVEGRATLVSIGEAGCAWISATYLLHRPTPIEAAVWELATSTLTHLDSFGYSLHLLCWRLGEDPAQDAPTHVPLTLDGAGNELLRPNAPRHREGLDLKDVIAYRVQFRAHVDHETFVHEMMLDPDDSRSIGQPLLRAVHLLEPVPSAYDIYSLHELEAQSSAFSLLEVEAPQRTLSAYVDLPALLREKESISITIDPSVIRLCEARLDGEVRFRPPFIDKQIDGA